MANLSNINNKFLVTTGGNVLIGSTANLSTYTGISLYGANPSLAIKTSSASGWIWTQYVNSSGTNNFSMGVNQSIPYWGVGAGAGMGGGTMDLVVASNGDVGVGTYLPNYKLHVVGNINIQGTGGYLRWNSGDMAIVNAGSYAMAFETYTGSALTEKMRITSGGNVGIGTDTPSALLEIQTAGITGNQDFQIFSRGESPNYEVFKISRAAGSTELLANQNLTLSADYDANHTSVDSNIIFKTDNTEKMRIDSSGNATFSGAPSGDNTIFIAGSRGAADNLPAGNITFRNVSNGVGDVDLTKIQSLTGTGSNQTQKGQLTFSTNDGTSLAERMRIDSSGNVNIATPITNAFYGLSLQYNATDTAEFKVNQATGQIKIGGVATGYFPTFYSAGSERMRILSNGRLLVGFASNSTLNDTKVQFSTGSGSSTNVSVGIFNNGTAPTTSATTTLNLGFIYAADDYVPTGITLGTIQFLGQANDAGYGAGSIQSVVTTGGNLGRSSHAVDMVFNTKPAGSTGNLERMRIDSSGNLTLKSASVVTLKAAPLGSTYGGGFNAITVTGISSAPYTSTLGFSNYGVANAMVIEGANVGVGITSPNTKLDVSGTTGTRNRNTTSGETSSVFETSRYYGVAGNATTNISIDTSVAFPPMASGGYILVEVSASGYGSGGTNGLIFSYITGGYGGHYAALNQPYHPVTIIVNTMQNGTCTWYNPNPTTIGITIANGSSTGVTGVMRVKVTTTY